VRVVRAGVTLAGAAPALVLLVALTGTASAQEVAYSGGLQFATGDYLFETRTDSLYVVSGLDLTAGRIRLGARIPFIVQSTPLIASGPVPVPTGGEQAGEVRRQSGRGQHRVVLPEVAPATHAGFGDPLLTAQVDVLREAAGRPSIRLGGSAKPPVASTVTGLSTGAWDVGTGVSVSKSAGVHMVSGDVSYWRFGDMDDLPLENAWSYAAAYGRFLGAGRWSMLVSASGFTSIIDGQAPPVQLGIGIGRVFSSNRSMTGNVSIGLTNTAPDVTAGIGWRFGVFPIR
jgi:hypothetical protein